MSLILSLLLWCTQSILINLHPPDLQFNQQDTLLNWFRRQYYYWPNFDNIIIKSVERKGKRAKFCSTGVQIVLILSENTLTEVVAALECCDRRWLFLWKEERSKNGELNVTGICSRPMKRNKENRCSTLWFSEAAITKSCKALVCSICVL